MPTILLLIASNCFMNYAWYGHLRHKQMALWTAILVSWLIACPEYLLAVPANRLGYAGGQGPFSLPQLKVLQEGISLTVFFAMSFLLWKQSPRWQDVLGAALIFTGLAVALLTRDATPAT